MILLNGLEKTATLIASPFTACLRWYRASQEKREVERRIAAFALVTAAYLMNRAQRRSKVFEKLRLITKVSQPKSALRMRMPAKIIDKHAWPEVVLTQHPYWTAEKFREWEKDLTTTLSFEDWLKEKKISLNNGDSAVLYLDATQRKDYEISFGAGKLQRGGEVFDTSDKEGGEAIFVIGLDRQFYAHYKKTGTFHHSSFLSGGPVLGAGTIKTNAAGELLEVTNQSGHYKPSKEQIINTLRILQYSGVDITHVRVTEQCADGTHHYNSGAAYLQSQGNCPLDGYNGILFIKTNGAITGVHQPDTAVTTENNIQGIKAVCKKFNLDINTISYSERNLNGDVIVHTPASDYIKKNESFVQYRKQADKWRKFSQKF